MTALFAKLRGMIPKKATMAILGTIVYLILPTINQRFGLGLSPDQFTEALYPFVAYIIGQGMADFGKEKGAPESGLAIRIPATGLATVMDDPNETPPA